MEKLVGKIICERVNVGSKSETDGYFIIMSDGQRKRIVVEGEHPYLQPTLKGLVGKRCEVSGDEFQRKLIVQKENLKPLNEALKLGKQ
jgi:hypothetical protein